MTQDHLIFLQLNGYLILENFIPMDRLLRLEAELLRYGFFNYKAASSSQPIIRQSPLAAKLCHTIISFVSDNTDRTSYQANRAFILDKSLHYNWSMPWHQDLKIAVKKLSDTPGYNNQTLESGIIHVEPPVAILEQLLTCRFYFDYNDSSNGAMQWIPGTHRFGRISSIDEAAAAKKFTCPPIAKGSLLIYKPLLLHRSPLSSSHSPRRILQIELSPHHLLPPPLQFFC